MVLSHVGLIEQLKAMGFSFNRNLGQNFITDEGFLRSIVAELKLSTNDIILEIGTGAGTLTRAIAQTGAHVVTYEIDKRLEPILKTQFDGLDNVELFFEDALKADINLKNFTLIANIPYYITTPLIMKFLNNHECRRICILIQDEVARRIIAKPGGKDYGALSVTCQAQANCKILKFVPRTMFSPRPDVDSAFIVIERKPETDTQAKKNSPIFERLLKGMFASRRKTVLNGLSIAFNIDKQKARELLERASIPENARAEQIEVEKFIALSDILSTLNLK